MPQLRHWHKSEELVSHNPLAIDTARITTRTSSIRVKPCGQSSTPNTGGYQLRPACRHNADSNTPYKGCYSSPGPKYHRIGSGTRRPLHSPSPGLGAQRRNGRLPSSNVMMAGTNLMKNSHVLRLHTKDYGEWEVHKRWELIRAALLVDMDEEHVENKAPCMKQQSKPWKHAGSNFFPSHSHHSGQDAIVDMVLQKRTYPSNAPEN